MQQRVFFIFAFIILLFDLYIFQAVKFLATNLSGKTKLILFTAYWVIAIIGFLITISFPALYYNPKYKVFITYAFAIVVGLFFFKLVVAFFFLIDDLRRLFTWLYLKFAPSATVQTGEGISRSAFLSWLGIGVGGTLFTSLLVGFSNKYSYRVKNIKLKLPNIPQAFKGLRIVQLSDIHSGSFDNVAAVQKGVQKVLDLKPDIILFTGDLVNNIYTEMADYKAVFAQLNAPMGVYSVLGNHDYGDYYQWEDRTDEHKDKEDQARQALAVQLQNDATISDEVKKDLVTYFKLYTPQQQHHLDSLKKLQADMGWKMLVNENVVLERGDDKIALIGIENWGARGRFPKYGRLDLAHKGTENIPFKILMSHDPSHWDAQITQQYKDIDLTLSGHTHGMQFGVEIPWLRWSPIQYVYKQWAGIYQKGKQHLYVNRGFGFLGYPGRVGIMPEITLIELA